MGPRRLLVFVLLFLPTCGIAQDIRSLKHEIATLASPQMSGRGYVQKGAERAAKHIMRTMRSAGLSPLTVDSSFFQPYTFPVVFFPDTVEISIGKRRLYPGEEYLVDAASASFHTRKTKIKAVDLGEMADSAAWEKARKRLQSNKIYLLRGTDSLARLLQIRPQKISEVLPAGAYIIPLSGKMTWTVATAQSAATVLYIQDSVLGKAKKASIDIHSEYDAANKNVNVAGMVRGTAVPDSYIVFCAHYDHLGKMGWDATFPGASDNASGTAAMLALANYYARHPQRYSMIFIAFSGEEAGLKGSRFFVKNPLVPLEKIRFLVNLDIMGDARQGVTVVNATEFPEAFSLLQVLNKNGNYLPEIRSRGKAANSDHYPFSEAGVPAFFLYSNGGPGHYHDIFDRPGTLALTNVDKALRLLIDFVQAIQ